MTDHTTSPTVTPDPDRDGVILHLPEITYLDTQTWAVDVGLTTEGLAALRTLLAVLPAPVDRAAVLREAADHLDNSERLRDLTDDHMLDINAAANELRRVADETAATETEAAVDLPDLAAALDGFGTLLATSSRDWGVYRVDAWLYAVTLGWDCEETEHDAMCTHGALEEMAQQHGWDDATVAKARRYRAAVRTLIETHRPAAGARQDGAQPS